MYNTALLADYPVCTLEAGNRNMNLDQMSQCWKGCSTGLRLIRLACTLARFLRSILWPNAILRCTGQACSPKLVG
jgi:hypothetical protein